MSPHLAVLALLLAAAPAPETRDLARHFPGFSACLEVLDTRTGRIVRHGGAQCELALSPCSTFKIPNSLIGLETGVLAGPETLLRWDGVKRERPELNQDHTLRTAIRDSVVWYYQEVARRVGEKRMQELLDRLGYGNRDISGGLTRFWLESSLLISADQQVPFLDRLRRGTLPVSARSQQVVREITRQEWGQGVDYHGKTGSCGATPQANGHGWWVGWVERGEQAHVFAANIVGEGASGRKLRPMVESALVELGVLSSR